MQKQILITLSIEEFETLIRDGVRAELNARPKEEPKAAVEYLSVKQTCAMLRISATTLRKYTRNSLFTGFRIGAAIRYRRNEIEQSLPLVRAVKHSRPQIDY